MTGQITAAVSSAGEDGAGSMVTVGSRSYRWRDIPSTGYCDPDTWSHPGIAVSPTGSIIALHQARGALVWLDEGGAVVRTAPVPAMNGHALVVAGDRSAPTILIVDDAWRAVVRDGVVDRRVGPGRVIDVDTTVLVAAGDMPELVPSVVELLLAVLDDPRTEAALLVQDGRSRPLPMALRRLPARVAAARLVAAGERRLGALPAALATTAIDEATWRALDPDGRTMRDIDTTADLRGPREDPRAAT